MSEGFRYISWGCGLQSTVLVQMVCEGKLQADAILELRRAGHRIENRDRKADARRIKRVDGIAVDRE